MWHLYIVRCADGSLYTGITTDVKRRLKEHRTGKGSRYLRSKKKFKLVHQEAHNGRSEASKREAQIKRLSHSEKKAIIQ